MSETLFETKAGTIVAARNGHRQDDLPRVTPAKRGRAIPLDGEFKDF